MRSNREPLLIWSSVLVTLQILTGGAALGDLIGLQLAGFFILVVAAMQGGTQFYIRGQVTENGNVIARLDKTGQSVAGEASHETTGTVVDVTVVPQD